MSNTIYHNWLRSSLGSLLPYSLGQSLGPILVSNKSPCPLLKYISTSLWDWWNSKQLSDDLTCINLYIALLFVKQFGYF